MTSGGGSKGRAYLVIACFALIHLDQHWTGQSPCKSLSSTKGGRSTSGQAGGGGNG